MWKCDACERHVVPVVQVCPFCTTKRIAALSTAMVTPIVLSACYGAPPCDPDEVVDQDLDGWVVAAPGEFCEPNMPDCDDTDPNVNPGAVEICDDGIDNNCDGWEAASDQPEVCNGLDDDCDGLVDEDGACDPIDTASDTGTSPTGDTGAPTPDPRAAIALTLTWSSDVETCKAAGVTELTVALRAQPDEAPTATRDIPCVDVGSTLDALPEGAWLVDASATANDGVRTWQSAARVVALTQDETLPLTLDLVCSSSEPDGCTTP